MFPILDKWFKNKKEVYSSEQVKDMVSDAVHQALNEERKWNDGSEKGDNFGYADNFYIPAIESSKDEFIRYEKLIAAKGYKNLSTGEKIKISQLMGSTGWTPTTLDTATVRSGTGDDLSAIQDACFKKYTVDPLGKSIVMNFQYFVIGKGIKVTCVVPELQEFILEFDRLNKMVNRRKNMVRSAYVEGEYFLKYVIVDENVYLRKVEPLNIEDIYTAEDDIEQILGYKVKKADDSETYIVKDINYNWNIKTFNSQVDSAVFSKASDDKFIQHIKYGEEEYLRGMPPLYPVLRWIKMYEDWLIDRVRLNHERAKVVWIRTRTGTKRENLTNPMSAPKGGIMLDEDQNTKYRTESSKLDSTEAKEDGLSILYMIGSGVNMPIHVLNQRASENVYASIRKADSPLSQMIEDAQTMWRHEWETMYKTAISLSGRFKDKKFPVPTYKEEDKIKAMKTVNKMVLDGKSNIEIIKEAEEILKGSRRIEKVPLEKVPINQIFPQVVQENALDLAKVLFLHMKMGIVSEQTASERAGYDWQEELVKGIKQVKDKPEEKDPEIPSDDVGGDGEPNT